MSTITIFDRWAWRRGTAANLAAVNEILLLGEACYETDTLPHKFKIGNGVTRWNDLDYVGELANLADPGEKRLVFWNDEIGGYDLAAIGANLTLGGTDPTLDASGSGGSGISSGTSNPGSPSNNDLFYRTDLGLIIYYNSATSAWYTVQEFAALTLPNVGFAGSGAGGANSVFWYCPIPDPSVRQLYLTRWECTTFVATTNDATRYWTIELQSRTAANVSTPRDSFTTQSETASNWICHSRALNLALPTTEKNLSVANTVRTGSTPGSILLFPTIFYRLIVT